MILKLFLNLVKAQLDLEAAKRTPVGGQVVIKKLAHGIKLAGGRWTLDCILHRDE